MSSLVNGVTSIVSPSPSTPSSTQTTVNVGATVSTSSGSSSTPSSSTPTIPTTQSDSTPVQDSRDKRAFAMAVGQTVYVNLYASLAGINPWQAYTVGWVFNDSNAVLVSEPNTAIYTGGLTVGANLRRKGETYANPAPGP